MQPQHILGNPVHRPWRKGEFGPDGVIPAKRFPRLPQPATVAG